MNPDASIAKAISGLNQLFLDSALAGIDEEAPPSQIETVLRCVAGAIADADPIRRAVVRDALIRRLRRAGVSCPVTLANAAVLPGHAGQCRFPTRTAREGRLHADGSYVSECRRLA